MGRLFAVNLLTHRLDVRDDVGHRVALPEVAEDAQTAPLLGRYVDVRGFPERDDRGRLTRLRHASVAAADDPLRVATAPAVTTLADLLASAPGPNLHRGLDLTDDEFAAFLAAIHVER